MTRGGFHGGGFHTGGFHGGGFRGGGFHGGFRGGYHGGHYHGGGFRSGGDDDELFSAYRFVATLIVAGGLILFFLLDKVFDGRIPGLDYINSGIFVVCGFICGYILEQYKRTEVLNDFRKGGLPSGNVWKGDSPNFRIGNYQTWYDTYRNHYCICFYEKEFGEENARKVKETMDRTPKILWINMLVWPVLGIVFFVTTFFFYELVIPVFENMVMTDEAFAFIDGFIFYLPSILTLLCSVAGVIIIKVRDNLLYKCASRVVNDNIAAEERMKTESIIASKLSSKWYYNKCPNCGADASRVLRICTCCGASLEVQSFESGLSGAIHRITREAEDKDS